MNRRLTGTLNVFFRPISIAVIGASRTPGRAGYTLVENLRSNFNGQIFPINANADFIAGLKAYRSVLDVPGEVDLAVILVPAEQVSAAVKQCAEKRVGGVIVEAADFAEIGPVGKARQDDITEVARRAGMRLWGPNCLGVIDTRSGVVTTYQPLRDVKPGRVSLVTQSGALAGAVLLQVHESRIFSFNKVCSIGNKADVDESDLLEYLANDPETKVIAMYLESINDGRRFVEIAKAITAEKPIIILKSGQTPLGMAASLSHTASLTGSDRIANAAFAEAGIIRVHDIGEFLTVVKTFDRLSDRKAGRRIAIICTTGAGGVLAADQLGLHGLSIATLSPETLARLHNEFPSWLRADQPLDISPTMMKVGPNRALQYAASVVLEDDGVDALLLQTFGLPVTAEFDPVAFADLVSQRNKPCVAWLYGTKTYLDPWGQALDDHGVPVMPDLRSAARSLQCLALSDEYKCRRTLQQQQQRERRSVSFAARPQDRPHRPTNLPTIGHAFDLLREYSIPVPPGELVDDPADAVLAASRIGYPVALKAADPKIVHKSDASALLLNLHSADAVVDGVAAIRRALPVGLSSQIYVQGMVKAGIEVIIGGVRDPQFGPAIMCGLGGIWVEIMKDIIFSLAPVTEDAAIAMLHELRAYPILAGARGQTAGDIPSLARAVVAVGRMMLERPEIRSFDINPFFVYPEGQGGCAVDVSIDVAKDPSAALGAGSTSTSMLSS